MYAGKFYRKITVEDVEIAIPLEDTVVYTVCDKCGKEISLQIEQLFYAKEICLNAKIICDDCHGSTDFVITRNFMWE